MLRKFIWFCFFMFLILFLAASAFIAWGYIYITRDLPKLSTIEDYKPPAVSRILAQDGAVVAEFFTERRYPIKLKDVPLLVRNAFLAAEDATFYSHAGIDPASIVRAFIKNIETGSMSQGGSTITQQVVKNLLLTPEKKLKRKLKEAILSYRLEKRFTKDEILEIYLNQIFFGNNAYGLKSAALLYFHKEPGELSLAEAALLAGLPKAPTRFSPLINFSRAKRRQRYVLDQMVEAGFITRDTADRSYEDKLIIYPSGAQNVYRAPYFVSEVRRVFSERWRDYNIDIDGLEIHTSLDLVADQMAEKALRQGLKDTDKRRGWRGPLGHIADNDKNKFLKDYVLAPIERIDPDTVYPALVTQISAPLEKAKVDLGSFTATVDLKEASWAKKMIDKEDRVSWGNPEAMVRVGDVIEVSLPPPTAEQPKLPPGSLGTVLLDQTPEIEGAIDLIDPSSGKVLALIGGYSYKRSVFNRVTQSLRQPGSAFKPIVYLAAVDGYKYTPSTVVYDTPRTFRAGDEYWTPANFDEQYLGPITLRTALEKSRNLVSAEIVSRIGVDAVIRYARKLGIESRLGRNLSLALGSSEVTLLELTRAYGVFAARGLLFESVFITRILDRQGNVIYDYENEKLSKANQVIDESSAFVMSNLLRGVVDHGTGYKVKEIGRPMAGKTGTSNEEMDTWFIGYNPKWACGVWVGFDIKKAIGEKETGGRVAAPIFLYFMRDFLNYKDNIDYEKLVEETKAEAERLGITYQAPEKFEPVDFVPPEGVEGFWVDRATGVRSSAETEGAFFEYFIKGTEPPEPVIAEEQGTESYLESPEL